ncbi:antibiotic biosynthesis monooxygenase [Kangiella sp. TOML190]|uniref:antibiotic biosynthesis monooxygenase family protein n=1 Tax=Kangiella sp. TOML190 TaxID=2931351 RepID=UPI00203AED66|nr:antibiotic biosynthesis monooxygenase family protein [Kangiella sp. TOML190]
MIRVVIERQISAEKVDDYHALIRKAKNKASNVPGFLSGELFSLVSDPNHVVVMSCWDTLEAWETWAESEQRVDLLDAMRPLLEADERVLVMESTNLK